VQDELCPIESVDKVMKKFCEGGANIYYQRNTFGNHNRQLGNSKGVVLGYLEDIMYGTNKTGYPAHGCRIETVTLQHDDDVPWMR